MVSIWDIRNRKLKKNYKVSTDKEVRKRESALHNHFVVTHGGELRSNHRYTPEIPEPAPPLSRHGVQIGALQVFSRNQNS